jgi:phage minor structural protein
MSVPILYEANATDFNNLGLGPLPDTIAATVTEERNGQFILEMQYPVDGIRSSLITKNRILKVDAGHKLKAQRFVIKRVNRKMGASGLTYDIYAEHISYVTADYALKPTVAVNGNGSVAMTQWLGGIVDANTIHVNSDITTENKTSWTIDKVQNAREALGGVQGSILDVWGGEYRFDNLNISLLKHRGTVSNTLLSYGRNITDFDQEENITNTYTSIYPFANYTVQHDNSSEQKMLTLPNLVIDSEYVKNYPNRKIKIVDFSDKFSTDETPTVERLTALAQSYIKSNNVGVPAVSTKISFVDLSKTENYKDIAPLEELDLCDEVPFVFDKFGIKTTAKVSRIVWNVLLDSYDSLELGELKTNLGDIINDTNNAANDAKDAANDAKNSADDAATSANGKNTNWYGPEDPSINHLRELREGDSWYKPNGEDTELYYWENGQWVFILSTKDAHDAADAADKAQEEANAARDAANDAVAKANDAVANAGFAKDTADQAKSDAASALQKALDAYAHGDEIKNGLSAEIDTINGQLSLKASKTDVDKIAGSVTDLEAELKIQAGEISSKVSRNDVTGMLSGYATQTWTQSQIKQTADAINLSVTQVNSRVDDIATSDRNLLANTGNFKTGTTATAGASVLTTTYQGNAIVKFAKTPSGTGFWDPYQQATTITPSAKEYTLSFYAKSDVAGDGFVCYFYNPSNTISAITNQGRKSSGTGTDGNVAFVLSASWERYWVKWTQKTDAKDPKRIIIGRTGSALGNGMPGYANKGETYMSSPMIVEGNVVNKAWTAAPEDYATVEKFSELQVTVNGIQGTVANKADKSQVTQLADQITSVVSSISNPNLIPNSGRPKDLSYWNSNTANGLVLSGGHGFYENGKTSLFKIDNHSATSEVIAGTLRFPVKPGKKYTISGIFFASSNVVGTDIWFLSRPTGNTGTFTATTLVASNVKYSPSQAEYKQYTFVTPKDANEGYVRIDNNGSSSAPNVSSLFFAELKMELGDHATPWVFDESQSQITQLADNINLRVQKNDVVNQINVSSEGILIDGKKVHITGQTSIDSAVIKDAMIANIKADKITAGTLNAANVHVINLDVNSLSGNRTNFVQSAWNGISSYVNVNANGINVGAGNGVLQLRADGMHIFDDYNGEDLGLIHGNHILGYPQYNGLEFDLNAQGDYMGWSYRNDSVSNYTMGLSYWPRSGQAGYKKGFNFADDLWIDSTKTVYLRKIGTINYQTTQYLSMQATSFSGNNYPYFGSPNGQAGWAYGSTETYLISGGSFYYASGIIKGLSGLHGKAVKIPENINSAGVVTSWYNITL